MKKKMVESFDCQKIEIVKENFKESGKENRGGVRDGLFSACVNKLNYPHFSSLLGPALRDECVHGLVTLRYGGDRKGLRCTQASSSHDTWRVCLLSLGLAPRTRCQ